MLNHALIIISSSNDQKHLKYIYSAYVIPLGSNDNYFDIVAMPNHPLV